MFKDGYGKISVWFPSQAPRYCEAVKSRSFSDTQHTPFICLVCSLDILEAPKAI